MLIMPNMPHCIHVRKGCLERHSIEKYEKIIYFRYLKSLTIKCIYCIIYQYFIEYYFSIHSFSLAYMVHHFHHVSLAMRKPDLRSFQSGQTQTGM